ncbi:MAG: hypothetical protein AB4040_03140 [Synechococcus sp.]
MKLKKIALAATLLLSTVGTLTVDAHRVEATPRILLVLAKLEARGTSSENGAVRPEVDEALKLDTCPNRATFCS